MNRAVFVPQISVSFPRDGSIFQTVCIGEEGPIDFVIRWNTLSSRWDKFEEGGWTALGKYRLGWRYHL